MRTPGGLGFSDIMTTTKHITVGDEYRANMAAAAREETTTNPTPLETLATKRTFLVLSLGYWGRGADLATAAKACKAAGAFNIHPAIALLIIGDDSAEVNETGSVVREPGSVSISLGHFPRLSLLINTN